MKNEKRKQLKALDEQLVKYGFFLQNLIIERAKLDGSGTVHLITELSKQLLDLANKEREKGEKSCGNSA